MSFCNELLECSWNELLECSWNNEKTGLPLPLKVQRNCEYAFVLSKV